MRACLRSKLLRIKCICILCLANDPKPSAADSIKWMFIDGKAIEMFTYVFIIVMSVVILINLRKKVKYSRHGFIYMLGGTVANMIGNINQYIANENQHVAPISLHFVHTLFHMQCPTSTNMSTCLLVSWTTQLLGELRISNILYSNSFDQLLIVIYPRLH